jgi:aerobic-type carbon monoxide dehydrogenase small subunit (CoxS/CutS family)
MNKTVEFKVNGQMQRVTTDSRRTLLDILREDLQLTGTKYGCGEGQCRACTVLLDGRPVASCQTSVEEAEGHSVETIESLGRDGALDPVQEALLQEQAMQCGYCVPGLVMTLVGLRRANARINEAEMIDGLNRHICRCCGYVNIVKAVRRLAATTAKREVVQ